jgi:hypothetical protein
VKLGEFLMKNWEILESQIYVLKMKYLFGLKISEILF